MIMTTFTKQEKVCLSVTTDSSVRDQSNLHILNDGELHSVTKLSCDSFKELNAQFYVSNHHNEIENIPEFVINKEGEFPQRNFYCEDIPMKTSLIDECGYMHHKAGQYSDCPLSKYGDVFFYTGRFFDLNEEVERELAEEEILHGLAEVKEGSVTFETKDGDADKVNEDSFAGDSGVVRLQSQLEDEFEALCSRKEGSEPFALGSFNEGEFDILHTGKKQAVRSVVPKLNLPKSARKGDQESVTSNDSIDRELLKMPADVGHRKKPSLQGLCNRSTPEELVNVSIWQEKTSGMTYEAERSKRLIYCSTDLHLSLLELFVSLMLTPQGTLEACYSDRFPTEGQKLNAPFFLSYHLNHGANAYLLPLLTKKMKDYQLSAFRILKLSCRGLFDPSIYTNRLRIAHGAFAQVYTATVQEEGTNSKEKLVVLKTVDLPKGPHDPCKFFDVYSEVEILEKFSGEPRVCQLLDYGVDLESFVLVLKHYKCSLKAWRRQHSTFYNVSVNAEPKVVQPFNGRLTLYLEIYAAVLQAVKALEAHNVVHYDIKCDNILLEPLESITLEEEFWNPLWPPSNVETSLPFRVCIADFGQSKIFASKGLPLHVEHRFGLKFGIHS